MKTATKPRRHEATKCRPILLNDDMVRSILKGDKTPTRRPILMQHPNRRDWPVPLPMDCPYCILGDQLWVREGFWKRLGLDADGFVAYTADVSDRPPNAIRRVPSIHMPRWASRITLEVTNVRVERVHSLTEADAIAEGFTKEVCANVLHAAAGKVEHNEAYYIRHADGTESEGWLCKPCADKIKKKSDDLGWGCTPETDGPASCDKCHRPLMVSLTEYGIDRELRLEDDPDGAEPQHFPCSHYDACISSMIADDIGDLKDKHLGRLAQIGFATSWHTIYEPRGLGWDVNPWAWVIDFRRITR